MGESIFPERGFGTADDPDSSGIDGCFENDTAAAAFGGLPVFLVLGGAWGGRGGAAAGVGVGVGAVSVSVSVLLLLMLVAAV
jgi:hypothetical protein